MVEKKTRKKAPKTPDLSAEEEDRRRFGALAFVENIDSEDAEESVVLSLDALRGAFAALEDESGESEEELESSDSVEEIPSEAPEYDEDFASENDDPFDESGISTEAELVEDELSATEINPRTIIEAMLFVGQRDNRPLSAERAVEKMRNVTTGEFDDAVAELNRNYRRLGCPYTIVRESDGYRMVLRPEFESVLTKFYGKIREARLSQQAIDTLAIVAYRQPITAEEVQKIRRQPSTALLTQLVRRGLLELQRETQDKKKIVLYRTTNRFLELFQLESIDDLPVAEDLDFR